MLIHAAASSGSPLGKASCRRLQVPLHPTQLRQRLPSREPALVHAPVPTARGGAAAPFSEQQCLIRVVGMKQNQGSMDCGCSELESKIVKLNFEDTHAI